MEGRLNSLRFYTLEKGYFHTFSFLIVKGEPRAKGSKVYRTLAYLSYLDVQEGGSVNLAEEIARAFHETYENFAPNYGYKTRIGQIEASAVPWKDVPGPNKALMIAVVTDLLDRDIILPGEDV